MLDITEYTHIVHVLQLCPTNSVLSAEVTSQSNIFVCGLKATIWTKFHSIWSSFKWSYNQHSSSSSHAQTYRTDEVHWSHSEHWETLQLAIHHCMYVRMYVPVWFPQSPFCQVQRGPPCEAACHPESLHQPRQIPPPPWLHWNYSDTWLPLQTIHRRTHSMYNNYNRHTYIIHKTDTYTW